MPRPSASTLAWTIALLAACATGAAAGVGVAASGLSTLLTVVVGVAAGFGAVIFSVRAGVDFLRPILARLLGEEDHEDGDGEEPGRHDLTICYAGADQVWAEWAKTSLAEAGFRPEPRDVRYVDPAQRGGRFLVLAGPALDATPDAARKLSRLTASASGRVSVITVDVGLTAGDAPAGEAAPGSAAPAGTAGTHPGGGSSGPVIRAGMPEYTARDVVASTLAKHGWRPRRRHPPPASGTGSSGTGKTSRYPGRVPAVWPAAMPATFRAFKDRGELLAELFGQLVARQPGPGETRARVLTGLNGAGKTSAAIQFTRCFYAYFDAVAWIDGGRPASIEGGFTDLAGQLGVTVEDLPRQMPSIWDELRERGRWLVVFDDVHDERSLDQWWPPHDSQGSVLITSYARTWGSVDPVPVDVFGPGVAVDLLCQTANSADRAGAARLADKLGYLPIALSCAASYVEQDPMSWSEYESIYDRQPVRMMGMSDEDAQQASSRSFAAAITRVRDKMPGAASLLSLLAFLSPDGTPRDLISAHADALPAPLGEIAADPARYGQARHLLSGYSLITATDTAISVNRLLQDFTRNTLPPPDRAAWAAAAVRLLDRAFPARPGSTAAWPDCARLVRHVVTATEHAANLDAEPLTTAAIAQRTAEYLAAARLNQQTALNLTDRAEALRRRHLGGGRQEVAETLITRARLLHTVGRVPEALRAAEEAVGILDRAESPAEHQSENARTLVNALVGLSDALVEVGRGAGVSHLERARAIAADALGPASTDTAVVTGRLGYARFRLGELGPSRDELARAVDIWAAAGGDPSYEQIFALRRLGTVLEELGDLEPALEREREARRLASAMSVEEGKENTEEFRVDDATGRVLARRGALTADSGDLAEAERLQRQALRHFDSAGMLDHISAGTRKNLAQTLLYAGKPDEALAEASAALAAVERIRGDHHPYNAEILLVLGRAQRAAGDLPAARTSLERARDIYQAAYHEDYLYLAPVLDELAAIARAQGDDDTAHGLAARARGIRDSAGIGDNPV